MKKDKKTSYGWGVGKFLRSYFPWACCRIQTTRVFLLYVPTGEAFQGGGSITVMVENIRKV